MAKKQPKQPPYADAERCIALRKRSKQGGTLTIDESWFCEQMFYSFPEWYEETEAQVFNETVPYGSSARL